METAPGPATTTPAAWIAAVVVRPWCDLVGAEHDDRAEWARNDRTRSVSNAAAGEFGQLPESGDTMYGFAVGV